MRYYSDVVFDVFGNVKNAVAVTVKLNGSLATIYNADGSEAANPVAVDDTLVYGFYWIASGLYTFWVDGTQLGQADLFNPESTDATWTATVKGLSVSNQGSGINWGGATANSATTSPFRVNSNHTGNASIVGGANLNDITINGDTVNLTSTQAVNCLSILHGYGGGSAKGSRIGLQTVIVQAGALTTDHTSGDFYVGGTFYSIASYGAGGSGTSFLTGKGHVFGTNPVARLLSGATNYYEVTGEEIDISAATGSTVAAKKGLQIVKESTDVVQGGDGVDTAILMGDQPGSTVGWNFGITFGSASAQWPIDSAGTLVKAIGGNTRSFRPNAAKGVDFSRVKFSSDAYSSMGFTVGSRGVVSAASAAIGPTTITSNSLGTTIDVPNKTVTSAVVSAGGSGYQVNDRIRTALGGVYEVATVSAGAVLTVTQLIADVSSGAPPGNPVATTADYTDTFTTGGSGCTLTLTWATANQLRLTPTSGTLLLATDGTTKNGLQIAPAATGSPSYLGAVGIDTNIDFTLAPKALGGVAFDYPGNGTYFYATKSGAGAVAAIPYVKSGTTGVAVEFGALSSSSDTNVDVKVAPKGTGVVSATGAITSTGSLTAHNATAIPAGGTAGAGLKLSSTSNFGIFFGSGAPSLAAAKGSMYLRSDGSSTSTRAYINTDGSTTWTALTTAA